jgi:transposase
MPRVVPSQLQIDFGERRTTIGDENVKVYLFVATLGYSRRLYVQPFRNERQQSWFAGLEGAFRHFGGITEEVLFDIDRGLVAYHDSLGRVRHLSGHLSTDHQIIAHHPANPEPPTDRAHKRL